MDNLWKAFDLSFLLRCLFSGFFAIVSFLIGLGTCSIYPFKTDYTTTILLISLAIGVPTYALHRAILYPLIEYIITRCFENNNNRLICIREATVNYLIKVWSIDNTESIYKKTYTWGDITHLSYMVGWNILAGIIALLFFFGIDFHIFMAAQLFFASCVFILAGLISDLRLRSVRERILSLQHMNGNTDHSGDGLPGSW